MFEYLQIQIFFKFINENKQKSKQIKDKVHVHVYTTCTCIALYIRTLHVCNIQGHSVNKICLVTDIGHFALSLSRTRQLKKKTSVQQNGRDR